MMASSKGASRFAPSAMLHYRTCRLRARAEINSHFAAGPQARWRGASDELYPVWYVRSEQQSQRACGPQPEGARRRAGICFVAAPRRCPTSPASRRLASACPALAPKCPYYFLTDPKFLPLLGAVATTEVVQRQNLLKRTLRNADDH